jgi:predicted dehydrogenase
MSAGRAREPGLDLAVVGCGGIAQSWLQALASVPQLRLRAVVEPDDARRHAAVQATGVTGFRTLPDLLAAHQREDPRLDGALVLTPPQSHEALSVPLLAKGIHVLCEKPLTTTTASAQRMVAAAGRDTLLMMGSKFRYVDDVVRARQLLDAGVIGEVVLFENVFCTHVDMTRRWNGVRAIAGGGVLIDNGSHSVDVARFLLGPIARVLAWFGVRVQQVEVEDTARLLFEADSGAGGAIDLSWSLHKEVPWYVRVCGTQGVLELGWRSSRWKRQADLDWTVFGQGYDKVQALRAQLLNFAAAALGQQRPLITAEDAVASVQVIETAYRSAEERRWLSAGAVGGGR